MTDDRLKDAVQAVREALKDEAKRLREEYRGSEIEPYIEQRAQAFDECVGFIDKVLLATPAAGAPK